MTFTQVDLAARLAAGLAATWGRTQRPILVGLCGPQGSGKSTLANGMARVLEAMGRSCAVLSIDDVYLTRLERRRLAKQVHPLLAVRGPPGTHDVALAQTVLDHLLAGTPVRMPRFDKGRDDRCDTQSEPLTSGPADVVIFEGWCVGARPQATQALSAPVNALERDQDPHGIWRAYVNQALAQTYQPLFRRLDVYVVLQAPSFDVVAGWRQAQEHALRRQSGEDVGMNDAEVARFVQHYERLSRHIASEAPRRADIVVWLDETRHPIRIDGA